MRYSKEIYGEHKKVIQTIGHRGAGFLEPENTIRAIMKGIELGMDYVEVDLKITKDGQAAVIHDETLDRTTNGKGKVIEHNLEEIRKLDAGKGEKVPLLEEAIKAVKGKAKLLIELKDPGLEKQVAETVKKNSAEEDVVIISYNSDCISNIKKIIKLKTGLICKNESNLHFARKLKVDVWLPNINVIDENSIEECHEHNIKIFAWPCDTEQQIIDASKLGVDAISSNKPDLLANVLNFDKAHEEYLDIVDENDNIIGTASWKEMFEKGLLHRTSNTIVLNSKGEIFVHRRAEHLKLYPGLWDVKFGGSVRSGETYEDAAKRELFEEAGIKNAILMPLFKLKSRRKENPVNRMVFKCIHDGSIKLDSSEVAEGRFISIAEVKKMIGDGKLSPSAVDVFSEYLKIVEMK